MRYLKKIISVVLVLAMIVTCITLPSVTSEASSLKSVKKITQTSSTESSITIKWKKVSKAKGYIVQVSTSKNGKYSTVSKIKKKKITTYTITKCNKKTLSSNTTYWVRVRAYTAKKGTKTYSKWVYKKITTAQASTSGSSASLAGVTSTDSASSSGSDSGTSSGSTDSSTSTDSASSVDSSKTTPEYHYDQAPGLFCIYGGYTVSKTKVVEEEADAWYDSSLVSPLSLIYSITTYSDGTATAYNCWPETTEGTNLMTSWGESLPSTATVSNTRYAASTFVYGYRKASYTERYYYHVTFNFENAYAYSPVLDETVYYSQLSDEDKAGFRSEAFLYYYVEMENDVQICTLVGTGWNDSNELEGDNEDELNLNGSYIGSYVTYSYSIDEAYANMVDTYYSDYNWWSDLEYTLVNILELTE